MFLLKRAAIVAIAASVLLPAAFGRGRDIKSSLGVPLFPGATQRPERTSPTQGKAAVSLQDVIVRELSADVFISDQSPDKVLSFYRGELRRLGAITECKAGRNVRVHIRVDADAVSDPSACQPSDFGSGETEIKVLKDGEQFIVSVGATASGTEFAIVHVDSARKCQPGKCGSMI